MIEQTWRVVLDDGSVREVRVSYHEGRAWPFIVDDSERSGVMVASRSARGAVSKFAGHSGWEVAEILAPGVATRTELATQLGAARSDFSASEEHLAAIVRAWEDADPDGQADAGTAVRGLAKAIRDAKVSRAGEWWR